MKVPGPDKTQWMRASMYMVIRLLIVLALLLPQAVYAACERYVSTGGSGIDCTVGDPCNIMIGIESASSGNEVCINDGTYTITDGGGVQVPAGVSIRSTNSDYTLVKIQPGVNIGSSGGLLNLISSAGTNGNQSISHLELAGVNGGYVARKGIRVHSRDNVTISNNYIHDFRGVYLAACIEAHSIESFVADGWKDFYPDDPGSDGNDFAIDALWPDNPVTGLEISYNKIDDGGFWDGVTGNRTGSISLFHIKDSTIHHNTFENYTSRGEAITGSGAGMGTPGKTALLDNVDIYNNDFSMGECYGQVGEELKESPWSIEIWVMKGGCDIYNNTGSGTYGSSFYSITYGKNTKIYDNDIWYKRSDGSPAGVTQGMGIEANGQSFGEVYGNMISDAKWGITVGNAMGGTNNTEYIRNTKVYQNVIENFRYDGVWVYCYGAVEPKTGHLILVDFVVEHNTCYGEGGSRSETCVEVKQTDDSNRKNSTPATGECTINGIDVRNNASENMIIQGGWFDDEGAITDIVVSYNHSYNGTSDAWEYDSNDYTGDPKFSDPGSSAFAGYTPTSGSAIIAAVPDIGYGTDGGAIPATGVSDSSPPTISSPDPYNGEILDAGTTSYNFTVSVSDATAVSGCRMSDSDESYADMSDDDTMADNGDGTWDNNLTGLTNDTSYTKYIACTDGTNAHTASNNFTTSFSVQSASSGTLLVDNSDGEYAETGTNWTGSTAVAGYYGDNYRTSAKSNETATWTFTVPLEGIYRVDAQWTEAGNRPVNVDYAIVHVGGTAHIEKTKPRTAVRFKSLVLGHLAQEKPP
jgi:hypothetical protein